MPKIGSYAKKYYICKLIKIIDNQVLMLIKNQSFITTYK